MSELHAKENQMRKQAPIMRLTGRPLEWCAKILLKHTAVVLVVLFCAGAAAFAWHLAWFSTRIIEISAMRNAVLLSNVLREFRSSYTRDVVERLRPMGVTATHDYQSKKESIPLPSTLTIEMGQRLGALPGGAATRLFSNYPFPWRKATGGPQDDFERQALDHLARRPEEWFHRFEDFKGRPSLRMASADIMRPACVNCHNTHPASPKRDWREGDVRGALEVIFPLDAIAGEAKVEMRGIHLRVGALGLAALLGLILVLKRLRRDSSALDLRRKHAETIVASVPAGLLTLRGDLVVLRANRSFRETFGVDDAALGRCPLLTELLPVEGLKEAALEVLSTGKPKRGLQLDLPAKDGSKRSLRIAIAGTRLAEEEEEEEEEEELVVIVEDVSEGERLSRVAAEMGRRYQEIMENATDGIIVMGQDGRISYINGAAEKMFGYERSEALGQPVSIFMPAQYREAHERGVQRYREIGESTLLGRVIPVEGLRKNGETFPLEISVSACRTGEGLVFTGIFRDVAERRRTEESLRLIVEGTAAATGADFFRLLAQNLAQALGTKYALVTRLSGSPSGCARTLAFWAGGSFAENRDLPLAGTPCEKVLAGESHSYPKGLSRLFPKCQDLVGPGVESYTGIPLVNSQKQVIGHLAVMDDKPTDEGDKRRDNILRIFGARAGAELDRMMAGESLTEREQQLRQSQKLDAVGKLAGGIAHDFNNILTAILGCSAFLLQNLKPDDANRADVLEIEASGKRAAGLTKQLLAFSRKQMLQPKRFDLNVVVKEIQSMLRRLIGEDIEMLVRPSDKPMIIQADQGQIEQVIMNLALNARDAMPKGGKIIIETSASELEEAHIHRHGNIPPGSYVLLAVSDTGTGMSAEVQAHLFEPFFTTKETGKGTGLGLPTVYGIIAQSGGHITAYSETGHGSTFRIYLPKAGERAENGESTPPKKDIPRGAGVVLLVEDEPSVRELTRRILTQNGFTVIATGDPLEALSLCELHKETIRLLVTDMVMPTLNGLEVARKVRAARPGTPVLYMSGYTEHFVLQQGTRGLEGAFLQKPFAPSVFLEKIHELLGA